MTKAIRHGTLTLEVFGALPLLAGLADNLDGAGRECANDTLRFVITSRSHDLDEGLDLLLLLIDIRDEELLAHTAPDVCGAGGWVGDVERLTRCACPLD